MGLTEVSVRSQRELTPPGLSMLCDVYFAVQALSQPYPRSCKKALTAFIYLLMTPRGKDRDLHRGEKLIG